MGAPETEGATGMDEAAEWAEVKQRGLVETRHRSGTRLGDHGRPLEGFEWGCDMIRFAVEENDS